MRRHSPSELQRYRLRMLASLAGSLLVVVGLLRFWPASARKEAPVPPRGKGGQEVIMLKETRPTSHADEQMPPPPAPLPPVVVPDEEVVEEIELDVDVNALPVTSPSGEMGGPPAPAGEPAPVPVQSARPIRFVEPEYPQAARRRKLRARIKVEVLVDKRGRVKEATVVRRFLLNADGQATEQTAKLGHGLEAAALAAARRWRFRPARQGEQPIASTTTLTFSLGVKPEAASR